MESMTATSGAAHEASRQPLNATQVTNDMTLGNKGGKPIRLAPGLKLTVEIETFKRRGIEYVFRPGRSRMSARAYRSGDGDCWIS